VGTSYDTQFEFSRKMRDAEINDLIAKLYEKNNSYSAEDQWYFNVPLAIRLYTSHYGQATTVKMAMACECKNFGRQVTEQRINWTDNNKPVLSASTISKDCCKCISRRVDWIFLTVYPDKSCEFVEFPCDRTRVKHLKSLALMLY
jgi:hypothetical protein